MLKTNVWSPGNCICSCCWSLNSGFLGWIVRGGEWKVSGQVYSGGQDQVQPDKYTEALPRYLCAGGQASSPTPTECMSLCDKTHYSMPVHENLYRRINQFLKPDSCFVINCWKCTNQRGWQKSRRYLITMALYKQHINYKEQKKIKQDVFYYEQSYWQHG